MRRSLLAALFALFALFAAAGLAAGSLYVLELKGGARLFALDRPAEKGRVLVFHRYPDGIYTSIAAEEVVKIVASASAPRTEKLQPGETMVLGNQVEGPSPEGSVAPPPPSALSHYPPDYGYLSDYGYGVFWSYGFGGGHHRPAPPPQRGPSNIGPNGFPILAPPGSPGSVPPPIGSNGFPVITPLPR